MCAYRQRKNNSPIDEATEPPPPPKPFTFVTFYFRVPASMFFRRRDLRLRLLGLRTKLFSAHTILLLRQEDNESLTQAVQHATAQIKRKNCQACRYTVRHAKYAFSRPPPVQPERRTSYGNTHPPRALLPRQSTAAVNSRCCCLLHPDPTTHPQPQLL